VSLVERYFTALQRGPDGEDELLGLFAEDAVFVEPFGRSVHRGGAAIRAYLREDAPPELRLVVERLDVAGDQVEAEWTGESPIFARPARGRDRFTIRDGRIARLDSVLLEPLSVDERAAELQRLWIGPHERHDAPITVAEPDPRWPALYEREAARIRAALGARALQVEHVGSTSVPGLAAKPIIDVALAVADPADEPAYVPDLEAAGYVLRVREPDWHEHRLLRGAEPAVNLHVFALGSPEIDRMTGFRDRLRADPGDRERYAAAKRELAARRWRYVQDYADAKSEVVEAILTRAGAGRTGR
jgi:GrpB-like predicted nucleotidyltransferase (UPF0157 family)/ketosteroid isomerase-like protein